MVACTYHYCAAINWYSYCFWGEFRSCSIHLYIILSHEQTKGFRNHCCLNIVPACSFLVHGMACIFIHWILSWHYRVDFTGGIQCN